MRILKYIFLLVVLSLVALTVYVATQKGQFDVTKSIIIKSPRTVIFNYVNDYRNWENWNSWKLEDSDMKFSYKPVTSGKGASYSWQGSDSDGSVQTVYVKDNDSIAQKMLYNGSPSVLSWKFTDTVGGTKVTWRAKGRLDFVSKIYAAAKGGAGTIFSEMFDSSLANLDKTLDYEINTYKINQPVITQKTGVMYLRQTIHSTIANVPKNSQILLSNMLHFFKKNKIATNGKPFIIYHSYNTETGLTRFSVCVPIREEIFTSAGSDITFVKIEPFRAVKVSLTGDYSHRKEAWDKVAKYISDNKITHGDQFRTMEVFTKGMEEIKSPSKWVTDIYIPVYTVPVPVATAAPIPRPAVRTVPISTPVVQPASESSTEP